MKSKIIKCYTRKTIFIQDEYPRWHGVFGLLQNKLGEGVEKYVLEIGRGTGNLAWGIGRQKGSGCDSKTL